MFLPLWTKLIAGQPFERDMSTEDVPVPLRTLTLLQVKTCAASKMRPSAHAARSFDSCAIARLKSLGHAPLDNREFHEVV